MLTIVGIILAIVSIVIATIMDGNSFGALIGPSSLVLVALGSFGATMAGYDIPDLKRFPKAMITSFTAKPADPSQIVTTLMKFAEIARREGVLALEAQIKEVEDPLLTSGLQLVVDGMDTDTVKAILDTELDAVDERHQTMIGFFKGLGSYAPTMGMIGTVVGLINMLQNLSDPSQLGLGMSVALLTTLYGVIFSNLLYLPIAAKLERLHNAEMAVRELVVEGVLAIQGGASPRMLVERLEARLEPELRIGHQARAKGATTAEAA